MSVNRFRQTKTETGDGRLENRVAPTKRPKLFGSRLFAVFFFFSSLFIAEIFLAWGASDSWAKIARLGEGIGNRHSRATYFVLNLLVHTNALLTVFRFRFRFHFVFSSFFVIVVVLFCLLGLEASSFG